MIHFIKFALVLSFAVYAFLASVCAPEVAPASIPSGLKVVAIESFLADIAQNVAGDRVHVDSLMPVGADPHSFEPTPQDVRKIAESDVLIVSGAGFEEFLDALLLNAGGERLIIKGSEGLTPRTFKADEPRDKDHPTDPHFWLDPTNVVKYTENVRDGLTEADRAGAAVYAANADAYIAKLNALDAAIKQQVDTLPQSERKLVTDHDTLGYYADRYGFDIVGMLVPSVSTADSTTARGMAELIDSIKAANAKAIFVEELADPRLAEQISQETGAKVITRLYTHSLSAPDGPAPTYLQMLEFDTQLIVTALK